MIPFASTLIAVTAALFALFLLASLVALLGNHFLRAMERARPAARVFGIAILACAPVGLAVLTGVGVGLFPNAAPFDLIAHHCHIIVGAHGDHESVRISTIAALATLLISALVLLRLVWATSIQLTETSDIRSLRAGSTISECSSFRVLETDASWAFVLGLVRPTIYLSRGLRAALTDEECEIVLAHETAHLKRHDLIIRFVCAVMTAFLPEAQRMTLMDALVLAQEEACDGATANRFSPIRIAETLLKVERLRSEPTPGACAACFSCSPLESRVKALLHPDYEAPFRSSARLALIAGGTVFSILVSLELLHHEIETIFIVLGG